MPSHNKKILILSGLALFALAAAFGYLGERYFERQRQAEVSTAFTPLDLPDDVTKPFMGDFQRSALATEPMAMPDDSFTALDGREVRFSDFLGKPTLVNFWASWCGPCVVELPALQKLAAYYDGRLNVVAVAASETRDLKQLSKFLDGRMIGPFAGYKDEGDIFPDKLQLQGLPTTFLVGADGLILYRFEGDADWTSDASKRFFDAVILQKK